MGGGRGSSPAAGERWLACCTDRAIISYDPKSAGLPNLPDFRAHRHDPSVPTHLRIAEGRPAFGRPDERTALPKDIDVVINRIRAEGFRAEQPPALIPGRHRRI